MSTAGARGTKRGSGWVRNNILGMVAIVIALGGTAIATQSSDRTVVVERHASSGDQAGEVKRASARVAKKNRKRGPVGPQGPVGAPGQQGAPGPQGIQGPAGTAPACAGNGSGDTVVSAGAVCIDRYEVSVWSSPSGGTQYGASSDDYPVACSDTGQGCNAGTAGEIYARSVAGVTPSRFITWFQAQQALANVGKRLPTNAEWQQAVAGTPDPGTDNGTTDCNTNSADKVNTGSRSACISNFGANDMVGNLHEWVADWDEQAGGCDAWPVDFGSDVTCLGSANAEGSTRFPGALFRGGGWDGGAGAGPFAVVGCVRPSSSFGCIPGGRIGFRGAR